MQTVMVFRAEESGPVEPPSVPLWRAAVAATRWQRRVGFPGRRHLPPGQGLLLVPCRAVHTIGMRFPFRPVAWPGEVFTPGRPWKSRLEKRRRPTSGWESVWSSRQKTRGPSPHHSHRSWEKEPA